MSSESRYTVRTWFNPGVSCKVTVANLETREGLDAKFESVYENSEIPLEILFNAEGYAFNLDLLFIITKLNPSDTALSSPGGPYAYISKIGIQPVSIDKFDSSGDLTNLGTEMVGKALIEVKRVIRENSATASISNVISISPKTERLGSQLVYGDTVEVNVTRISAWY